MHVIYHIVSHLLHRKNKMETSTNEIHCAWLCSWSVHGGAWSVASHWKLFDSVRKQRARLRVRGAVQGELTAWRWQPRLRVRLLHNRNAMRWVQRTWSVQTLAAYFVFGNSMCHQSGTDSWEWTSKSSIDEPSELGAVVALFCHKRCSIDCRRRVTL